MRKVERVMSLYPRQIPIGSIIEGDVITENGAMYAKRGTIVDRDVYEILKRYQGCVDIRIEFEISDSDLVDLQDRSLKLPEDIKDQAVKAVEYIYGEGSVEEVSAAAIDIADVLESYSDDHKQTMGINLAELKISDDYTFKHSVDVAVMGCLLAKEAGMSREQVKEVCAAGILHDIGKMDIPEEILKKPGKLLPAEFDVIKKHPVYGYHRIKDSKSLSDGVKLGVLQHHEKYDGTGYPLGLTKEKIHPYGQVLTVCDVYDALVTERPYKEAKAPSISMEIMFGMFNSFNPDMMKTFTSIAILYPIGDQVLCSDGVVRFVMAQNKGFPLRPILKDFESGRTIDLAHDSSARNITITCKV